MRTPIYVVAIAVSLTACSPFRVTQSPSYPELDAYPALFFSGENHEYAAAYDDFRAAANYCRTIHNNYETNTKKAEYYKLMIGSTGGVFGFVGSMLAAAGTGGYAAALSAGVAGVSSAALGTAETGPLAPGFYEKHRQGIAQKIQGAADASSRETDPKRIYAIANSLAASCLAAETAIVTPAVSKESDAKNSGKP